LPTQASAKMKSSPAAGKLADQCGGGVLTRLRGGRGNRPSKEDPDLGASLSRLLARAHEALSRNAIDLTPVACLPAFGFGIPGSSCHEVPTRVSHAADEVVDARPGPACAMGSIPLPAALNGLGRLLHLRKPRQWARGARCESQREDHGRL